MRQHIAAVVLCGLACLWPISQPSAHGQAVRLPNEVKVQAGRMAAVTIEFEGDSVKWITPPGLDVFREYDPDPKVIRLRLIGYQDKTTHALFAIAAAVVDGKARLSEPAVCLIVVGEGPPTPPGPGPNPPPGPGPPPTPNGPPIPAAGFRVLIVYESAELSKLPAEQRSALRSQALREYLNRKCVTGPDGKTKEWNLWDDDVVATAAPQLWQDVLNRVRNGDKNGKGKATAFPWIVISDGKTGYEGPFPQTLDETLKLLKKYGGE